MRSIIDIKCHTVGFVLFSVSFSDVLNNIEEHITVKCGSNVAYALVPKDSLPEGYEELENVCISTNSSSLANSLNLSMKELSTASAMYSSDSDVGTFYIIYVVVV